jgi:TatD DNase family protein
MIDTHCHLTNPQLSNRIDEVIEDAKKAGVHTCITVSTDGDDAIFAREVSANYDSVYFSSGIHPLHADGEWKWKEVTAAAKDPKCVAWGELGLDRHYSEPDFDLQKQLLEEHLALIEQEDGSSNRPIIVHCRKAVADLLPIFRASTLAGNRFVFHCFTESKDDARKILEFGAKISFTGVVTYKNASEIAAAARLVPIDQIMVETDAPYLSPEPVRAIRPNEPKYVVHTAAFLAGLFGLSTAQFGSQTDQNATIFFNLPI